MYRHTKMLALIIALVSISAILVSVSTETSEADHAETDYSRYYYDQLSPLAKDIYDRWRSQSDQINGEDHEGNPSINFTYDIDLSKLSTTALGEVNGAIKDEIDESSYEAIEAYTNESYDTYWMKNALGWTWVYWHDGENVTRISITYSAYLVDGYPEMNLSRTEIFDILSTISVDETTRYSTVRSIHDATVKTLSYAAYTDDSDFTIRSIFRDVAGDHSVVCEGYAKMFKALCDLHGVPCLLISGHGEAEAHMWNYVQMEDGKWYGVDCTWDDMEVINQTYLLIGTSTHGFTKTFGASHNPDRMERMSIPELSTDSYNLYHTVYFVSSGSKVETKDVEHGSTVSVTPPTRDGFTFDHWEYPMGGVFNLSNPITNDLTLVAVWTTESQYSGTTGGDTWAFDPVTSTLTISGTGGTADYTTYDGGNPAPWYAFSDSIRYAVVEEGVTYIGDHTFSYLWSLLSVSFPSTMTNISDHPADCCYNLVDICNRSPLEIIAGDTGYNDLAYYALEVRDDGDIPIEKYDIFGNSLYYMEHNGEIYVVGVDFTDDTITFTEVLGGQSEYRINRNLLYGNERIRNVVMLSHGDDKGVISVGEKAFFRCRNLESIGFTPGTISIGDSAFEECNSLRSVYLPSSLTTLGSDAFRNCTDLTVADLSSVHMTDIPVRAFYGCSSLKEIVISDYVETIETNAFSGCTGLTRISFGNGLTGVSTYVLNGITIVIGGVEYNEIPGDDDEERAEAVKGKTFSGSNRRLVEDKYNLYYVLDGNIINEMTVQHEAGDIVTLAELPTVDDHVVIGWYLPGIAVTDNTFMMPANTLHITAKSFQLYYTVTIDLGDATVSDYDGPWTMVDSHTYVMDVLPGTDVACITLHDSDPLYFDAVLVTPAHYHFNSWSTNHAFVESGTIISANLAIDTFPVTFDGNGSTYGNMLWQNIPYNTATALNHNEYTKDGYRFLGWAETADGNVVYTDGANITVTEAKILFAKWQQVWTVTFDGNGSTGGSMSAQIIDHNVPTALTANVFTKEHYHFIGWANTEDGDVAYADGADITVVAAKILYAKWDIDTVSITFNGNGSSSGSMSVQNVPYDTATALTANGFTKEHYHFMGWATSSNGDVAYSDSQAVTLTSGLSLYAKWEIDTVAVSFNGNGSTGGSMSEQNVPYNTATALNPNGFTRTGYRFLGWANTENGDVAYADGANITVTEAKILFAKWQQVWTVTFNGNGSTGGSMSAQIIDHNVPTALNANAFTKEHYHFIGWAETEEGSIIYLDGANITVTSARILYAKWEIDTVAITFDGNGSSSGSMSSQNVPYNTATALNLNGFTKTGYRFLGWANSENGDVAYADGANITITEAKTLYAKWQQVWTVTFNGNGSTGGSMSAQIIDHNVPTALNVNAFTREHYHFMGWATSSNGDVAYSDSQAVTLTSGLSLYAKWEIDTVAVSFNGNGSTGGSMSEQNVPYNTATALNPNGFTRTGYTFLGWANTNDGGVVYADGSNITVTEDKTIYAVWGPNTYHITLMNMNSNIAVLDATYGSNVLASFQAPSKTGNTLEGYFISDKNSVKVINADGTFVLGASTYTDGSGNWIMASDLTLYAVWSNTQYTLTLDKNGGDPDREVIVTYDSNVLTSFAHPTRTGYNIAGYYTEREGGILVLGSDGKLVKNVHGYTGYNGIWQRTSDATLYAHWTGKNYNMTIYSNGGDTNGSVTVTYGSSNVMVHPATKTGYHMVSCYDGPSSGVMYIDSEGHLVKEIGGYTNENGEWIRDGMTLLYARWAANEYSVSFDNNGGTGTMVNQAFTYDVLQNLSANIFTRTGYTFIGWNTMANGSGTSYAAGASVSNLSSTGDAVVALYAQWSPIAYSVSFDNNGGAGTMVNQAFTYDVLQNLSANTFTRTGYTFGGWNTMMNGSGTSYAAGASVSNLSSTADAVVALYAQWVANPYDITLNKNGGSENKAATATFDSGTLTPIIHTSRVGYNLSGYFTAESSGSKVIDANGSLIAGVDGYTDVNGRWIRDSDAILYAQWTPIAYSVSFDNNGGTGTMVNQAFTYDVLQNLSANTFTRTGYTFGGWNTMMNGSGTSYAAGASVSNLSSTADAVVALYAQWTPIPYSVSFNANQGTGSMSNQAFTYDVLQNLSANTFTRTGYTFSGWNTSADGTGSPYVAGASVSNLSSTADAVVALYAQWSPIAYSVSFDNNGGTGSMVNQAFTYDAAQNLSANTFTRTGYTFGGWNTMANGSGTSYAGGASVSNLSSTADAVVTLYAQWSLIDYSITYHVNGGTGIGNNPTQYNVESQIILSGITREHYTFAGWFSDEGLTVAVTSIAPGTIGDIDLYAKWTEILYVVSLDLSGGRFTQSPEGWTSNNGVMLRSYLSGTSIATIVSSLGSPVKDPSTTLSYMFDSWDVISGNLFGDLKITASYKASFIIPEPSEGTTSVDSSEVQVATLSSESITSLKESVDNGKLNDVEIILKEGALSLDSESIRSLTGTNLEVSIKKDVEIPETVKGAAEGRSVYEIRIGDVHEFGGKLKITLDYKLQNDEDPDKLVIWNIKDDGTHEVMQCDYSNGKISFSTTHLSYYAVMVDDSSEPQSFPWVWIVVGAVLLVAAAGVAFFVIKKKA